ncbi:hypothetical protein BDP27DRAFT_1333879 [Rhodocollybia butyracea]|uniref:Uncharacterized protein n=1 Tax=Rhodocollybia butyracea TaxID=206335 RepID=A0A9P5PHZ8_9AGAR|nr:hypothetical protein BDP27DRAFT_1333879 [Rhodocollybia butyracea]
MRALLLFMLVAISVLAVSSISAVDRRAVQSKVKGNPPVTHSKPKSEPKLALSKTPPIVTFISGKTGKIMTTGLQTNNVEHLFNSWISKAFDIDFAKLKPIYKGRFKPSPPEPKSRQWVYITITRFQGRQWFGWVAFGNRLILNRYSDSTKAVVERINGLRYFGISPGKPTSKTFRGTRGKPVPHPKNNILMIALAKEWYKLLGEFKRDFMAPPVPSVTFTVGIGTGGTSSEPSKGVPQELTKAINGALRRSSEDQITYSGLYLPAQMNQRWVYFTLVGIGQCGEADPCFGWMAMGHDFKSSGDYFDRNHAQIYVGIVKWEVNQGKSGFTVIGEYPATRTLEQLKAIVDAAASSGYPKQLTPLGQSEAEWWHFMEEFVAQRDVWHQDHHSFSWPFVIPGIGHPVPVVGQA